MTTNDQYTIFPAHTLDAEHIMTLLLDKGLKVHGIVRDDCRHEYFQELKQKYKNFDYKVIDITDEDQLRNELDKSKFVFHLSHSLHHPDQELNDKVLKCLNSFMNCIKDVKGLEKLILVSTLGTVCNINDAESLTKAGSLITEKNYNEEADMSSDPVSRIRVNFEELFFELVKKYNINYAVLNTGFFVGPLLSKRNTGKSIEYIKSFFENKVVNEVYPLIDVRDIAKACYAVTTNGSNKGKYLITDERFTYPKEVYEILKRKFPTCTFKTQEKTGSTNKIFDTSKAKMELRLQLRPKEESIADMVKTMRDFDLIHF